MLASPAPEKGRPGRYLPSAFTSNPSLKINPRTGRPEDPRSKSSRTTRTAPGTYTLPAQWRTQDLATPDHQGWLLCNYAKLRFLNYLPVSVLLFISGRIRSGILQSGILQFSLFWFWWDSCVWVDFSCTFMLVFFSLFLCCRIIGYRLSAADQEGNG